MNKKTVNIILIAILILGSFLRLYNIGKESFWVDEAATVYTTQQHASEIIKDIYTTNKHAPQYYESGGTPPFYFVLANYWTKLFGLSEIKLRSLSAMLGIISIYLIFLIGKILFNDKVGLVSAFLLSINYMHIRYSQEARTYSLIILLTMLTVFFLLKALRKKRALYWCAYVVSSAMLIYSHYFGFFILFFEYLFLVIFWKDYKNSLHGIIISAIGIFLLYAPWLPALIRQMSDSKLLIYLLGKNVALDFARIFIQFNSWFTPDLETRNALSNLYHYSYNSLGNFFMASFVGLLTIASILAFTSIMGWYFFKAITFKKNYIILLMWFLVPLLIPIMLTFLFPNTPVFGFIQHVLFVSPAYYLIVANGILKSKKFQSIIILLSILSLLPLYSYYSNFDKEQWREAAQYLKLNREAGELVVTFVPNNVLPLGYYYKEMDKVTGVKNVDDLKLKIKRENSIWLLYASEIFRDPEGTIKNYLDTNYKLEESSKLIGIKIFHYTRRGSPN